ncbi:hypothetical protein P153DRAFT_258613, partial [Dothidotthia symphoricarpi CBS 119687]
MPPKRGSEDEAPASYKIQRVEHDHQHHHPHQQSTSPHHRLPNNDFSGSVKRKLADSKRTGQACDRCKIRKIRCDGRPEGCTSCEQNRTPCRTTDRITGRATTRGHAEAMEAENTGLRAHIADLQAQLKEVGVDPRAPPAHSANLDVPSHPWTSAGHAGESQAWMDPQQQRPCPSPLSGYAPASSGVDSSEFPSLPHFKYGSIGDNYLGVASGDSLLSHIRGTSLSVFGTQVDLTDFMMGDAEYEKSVMSYTTLVQITVGGQKVERIELPPYNALREYAGWYLRSLNPYTMLLHRPALMQLVWSFGNDPNFTPTAPETVFVHMMLATIKYQVAARNSQQDAMMEESHAHYKYALSFYKDLLLGSHRLESIQAMAMICHHLRNFPKPGAAWIFTSMTHLFATELGMHRSVKAWAEGPVKLSKIEIEMRKRVFWTLHALTINLSGKLGRPMPVNNDDIDVEFPEPMNDCLPGEEGTLDTFHQCSFQVGIQVAKHCVWELSLNKLIYSVRHSPRAYVENLKRLEAGIRQWKEDMPFELRDPSHASQDDHIFALYLEYWYQSYQLLLHHPAVCRSMDAAIINSNLDKCLDASQKMLLNCTEMMHKKSLDIPWINTVVYIAAIFTTLFISSRRKELMSPVDMTRLKGDMATWINVLGECDHFLGSGDSLKNAISTIVDQSLANINDSIVKRTESLARAALQSPQHGTAPAPVYENNNYHDSYTTAPTIPTDPTLTSTSPNYNTLTGPLTHPYNLQPVSQPSNNAFDQQPQYTTREDNVMTPTHAAALAAASSNRTPQPQPQNTNNHYVYQPQQPTQTNTPHHPQPQNNYANTLTPANALTPQDWRQWSAMQMQPQPQLGQGAPYHSLHTVNTATSLMSLAEREGAGQGPPQNQNPQHMDGGGHPHPHPHPHPHAHAHTHAHAHAHWPEIQFPGMQTGN